MAKQQTFGDKTKKQAVELRIAGEMSPPEHVHLDHGKLHVTVPAHGLAVVVIAK